MNISRRQFSLRIGLACAATACRNSILPATENAVRQSASGPLRVIAYNVYGCQGWPKERELAKQAVAKEQMAERLALELALYNPDIINFSESPAEKITNRVAELLQMNVVRFPSGGNWPGTLLSRFKILKSENVPLGGPRPKDLFTRHWGKAELELAADRRLVIHSAHLFPTAEPTVRFKEIRAMIDSMEADLDAKKSMLLIGDLNHGPDTEEANLWKNAGWVDGFSIVGKGNGFTIPADHPKWRIDYVLAAGPIAGQFIESKPLFEGAFRLDPNDLNSFALSDHLPQYASFQI